MPEKIIDLDEAFRLLPLATTQVKLEGKVYTLPADCPTGLALRVQRLFSEPDKLTDEDAVAIGEGVLALFQVHHPEFEELPMGIASAAQAVYHIYLGLPTKPPKAAKKPAKKSAPTSGTKSTPRRKSSASSTQ